MAEKKVTPKKTLRKKEEKLSPEEIKKKREEVLRRLNEELGESVVVEETITEIEISDTPDFKEKNSKEFTEDNVMGSFQKEKKGNELMEQEIISEDKEINEEPGDEESKDELKKKEVVREELEQSGEGVKEEKVSEEISPFSAAEFGLADRSKNKTKNIILFLVIFVLVVIISAVFYFYFRSSLANIVEEKPETTITPTEAPTATPEPVAFERGEISVQILNGSGTAGVAGTMQEFLEGEGYENIEVGNAEEFDYENVTIQLKKEFEDYFDEISSDIEKEYTVNEEFDILEEDSEYDMVVIVGTASEEDTEAPLSDE